MNHTRSSQLSRHTKETRIELALDLDQEGGSEVSTGLGFLDHMLLSLARFWRVRLVLRCEGDLHIDDHHTTEDCALALGAALLEALGDRRGLRRFGSAYAPLDEALARVVLDLSGRPWPEVHLNFTRETLGQVSTENLTHFFQSFAMSAKMSLHVDLIRGINDHHKAEAAFKALGLALREACSRDGHSQIPSEKGTLS